MYRGTGCLSSALFVKLLASLALLKLDTIAFAAATYFNLQMLTQSINAGNTHAVQAAGNLIAAITEFTTGVKHSHNYLYSRLLFLFHHIHRDTTAIIDNRNTVILMDDYLNLSAVTGQGFVNTVVHNLVDKMV